MRFLFATVCKPFLAYDHSETLQRWLQDSLQSMNNPRYCGILDENMHTGSRVSGPACLSEPWILDTCT